MKRWRWRSEGTNPKVIKLAPAFNLYTLSQIVECLASIRIHIFGYLSGVIYTAAQAFNSHRCHG